MSGKRELRLAITGALVFLFGGVLLGCGGDSPTAPTTYRLQADGTDTTRTPQVDCKIVGGVLICY